MNDAPGVWMYFWLAGFSQQPDASWQDTASALGTLLAVGVALAVAIVEILRTAQQSRKRARADRIATAGTVSAWVEEEYVPNNEGSFYVRKARVYLANESNEPVFRVTVSIGVGFPARSIGPLAVPAPIPVLPARRTLSWDISLPLKAHDDSGSPCAEMGFSDSANRRWLREFDGTLVETTGRISKLVDSDDFEKAEAQVGRLDNVDNPMAIVFLFLNLLSAEPLNLGDLRTVFAEEAPGWSDLDAEDAADLAEELADYGLAGFVSYPAPHVAYVKILPPAAKNQLVVGGDQVAVGAKIITLTYLPARGWRIFSFGPPTEADRILFPDGTLHSH